MGNLPSGTVTLLFTDIEGSTRLLDALGDAPYGALLEDHSRILEGAFAAHGGVIVDTEGDSFFVGFPEAGEALAAAAEAQGAVASHPWPVGCEVRVRMGLHSGTPLVRGPRYVGLDVHRAARVMSAGHGGQVLISEAARRLMSERITLRELGEHRLKDLGNPIRLYQLGDDDFPPLKTLYRTNLPIQPTPLLGRERELEEGLSLLGEHRLLTLLGPGGAGKTRLALQLAADATEQFPDGLHWVPLQALRDPALVEETIAQALGATDGLAEHIADRQMLILLDNLEQLLDAGPALSDLLATTPYLKILATSREPLRIAGEQRYLVEPLFPEAAAILFTERARALDPGFESTAAVEEICRRLDGLPLAVELAAARMSVLSPEKLLSRLGQRLPVLTGGARDAPERQRTLRAAISWSYDLLSHDEQDLVATLSVFTGSFDYEAADSICDASVDAVQSLVEKSLVRRWSSGRFGMLETIHEFAAEQLERGGKADEFRKRFVGYYSGLAEPARGAPPEVAHEMSQLLDNEHANFREALRWCIDWGERGLALELVQRLWVIWIVRGRGREGDLWARRALEMPGEADALTEAVGLAASSELARWSGDRDRAVAMKEQAIPGLFALGEVGWATAMMIDLVHIHTGRGEIERAASLSDEALSIRREIGDQTGVAHALEAAAQVRWAQRGRDEALAMLQEATEIWDGSGFRGKASECRAQLADMERRLGRLAEARANFVDALSTAADEDNVFVELCSLRDIGSLAVDEGRPARAAKIWGATAILLTEAGLSLDEAPSDYLEKLGAARRLLGNSEFDREWHAGAALSRDEAVALALLGLSDQL